MEENKIVIYQTEDGQMQIDVRLENETVWLTQQQIAELFGTQRPAITKHLKNIYASEELDENSTCSILEHMGNEGKRTYSTKYYNLDATLFLWFLNNNHILYYHDGSKRIADSTLVALTLMIAESRTEEKDIMVKVVVNLINQQN